MVRYFFTSDLHFNHKRIIDFGYRPFKNLKEMTDELVKRWNIKVKKDDVVFIVGDFSFSGSSGVNKLFKKLNGDKVYIHGNHDRKDFLVACFINMLGKGWEVVHNPEDSSAMNVIHGHIHIPNAVRVRRQKNGRLFINVNTELWGYAPVSVKQIGDEIERLNKDGKE